MGIANIINNSTTTSGGEIVRELVNASDGAGLHFEAGGNIELTNSAAAEFGTSDFSVEFVLNQSGDNTNDNVIYYSHQTGNNRFYIFNDISQNTFDLGFVNSSGSTFQKAMAYDMSADYGTPTHYVLTCDRDGDATLYKNGNSVATVDISDQATVDIGESNTTSGYLGSWVSTYGVLGTFYRFRTWNKALSSAEVQTAYERADVPVADQYGSASNEITNGNFETNTSGWTSENTSTFQRNTTSPISGTGDLEWTGDGSGYPAAISNSFSLTAGKKYRIKFTYRVTSGTVYLKFGKTAAAASAAVAGISEVALTASSNTAYEATITPTETTTAYIVFRGNNNTTPTMFVDLVDFVQIGCVSDYDLAFANENQSRMVADRSTNNVDGEMSSSGVKQTQVIKQLNSTAMRVGGTSATPLTPADGELMVDSVDVRNGNVRVIGGNQVQLLNAANDTNVDIINSGGTGVAQLGLRVAGSEKVTVASNGNIRIGDQTSNIDNKLKLDVANGNDVFLGIRQADQIQWHMGQKASDTSLYFRSGNVGSETDHLIISSTGLATFSAGVNLGNTASATATTLDGYEEGTFTVTNNGDTTGSFVTESGEYTRIGNCVYIRIAIRIATNFTSNRIGGLPFGCVTDGTASSWSPIGVALGDSGTDAPVIVAAQNGVANLAFFSNASVTTAHAPNQTTGAYYRVTGFYYTTDAF